MKLLGQSCWCNQHEAKKNHNAGKFKTKHSNQDATWICPQHLGWENRNSLCEYFISFLTKWTLQKWIQGRLRPKQYICLTPKGLKMLAWLYAAVHFVQEWYQKRCFILLLRVLLSPLFNLCSYTLIVHKRYQEKEELTSSVRVTLKGVARVDRIWDAAEYTIPTQASLNLMPAQYSTSIITSGFFPSMSAGMSSEDFTFETAMF